MLSEILYGFLLWQANELSPHKVVSGPNFLSLELSGVWALYGQLLSRGHKALSK